jgi:hypothetical protein
VDARSCLEAKVGERDTPDVPTEVVYVELRDEGVDVCRPVDAEWEADDVFRLPPIAPEGEHWAFAPGSRVRCERRSSGLVAVALAD